MLCSWDRGISEISVFLVAAFLFFSSFDSSSLSGLKDVSGACLGVFSSYSFFGPIPSLDYF